MSNNSETRLRLLLYYLIVNETILNIYYLLYMHGILTFESVLGKVSWIVPNRSIRKLTDESVKCKKVNLVTTHSGGSATVVVYCT